MYFRPNARITVGNVTFHNVNSIQIVESVTALSDTAKVIVPRNWGTINGLTLLDFIGEGDKVLIEAGVNEKYHTEFEGYLNDISTGFPLRLNCEDNFYQLKRNNWNKAYETVKLKELLTEIAPGYTINAPEVDLGPFQIADASTYKVLQALKEQYGFFAFIKGRELNCNFAFDVRGNGDTHEYTFGTPSIKDDKLVYQRKEDVKIRIKGIANQRNGEKLTYETGSTDVDANIRTLNFGAVSQSQLEQNCDKAYESLAFDGFTGTITGFAEPRTKAGDTLKLTDPDYPEKDGSYLIEKVVIDYDLNKGFQRANHLSYKL